MYMLSTIWSQAPARILLLCALWAHRTRLRAQFRSKGKLYSLIRHGEVRASALENSSPCGQGSFIGSRHWERRGGEGTEFSLGRHSGAVSDCRAHLVSLHQPCHHHAQWFRAVHSHPMYEMYASSLPVAFYRQVKLD